jgi:hypothetical protein
MAVDYDDQAPNLGDEEDPRHPDPEFIAHDREGRDSQRLEHDIRGSGHHDRAFDHRR